MRTSVDKTRIRSFVKGAPWWRLLTFVESKNKKAGALWGRRHVFWS